MNTHPLKLTLLSACCFAPPSYAEIVFDSGATETIDYAIHDIVRLRNGTSLTLGPSGLIRAPNLSDAAAITVEWSSGITGVIQVTGQGRILGAQGGESGSRGLAQQRLSNGTLIDDPVGSALILQDNALVAGGRGAMYGGATLNTEATVTLSGQASLVGGFGGNQGGMGLGGANEGLTLSGNSRIQGGFGGQSGGHGYDISRTSGWGHIEISDSARIIGGMSSNQGGEAIAVGIEGANLRMDGGTLRGGYGGVAGGNGLLGDDFGTNLTMNNGLIAGGNSARTAGTAYKGDLTLLAGELIGGSGGTRGGHAYIPNSANAVERIGGGTLRGGYGGQQGGHAIHHVNAQQYNNPAEVIIEGGQLRGGDSNGTGGSAIYIGGVPNSDGFVRRGFANYTITGGMFDAGDGATEDGWLIAAVDTDDIFPDNYATTVNISGGLFGSENAGLGFGLWTNTVFNIYGSGLSIENGILSGTLQDGNSIYVPVFFADNFYGEFNLIEAAPLALAANTAAYPTPLPASAYLFGAGLIGLAGIARRRAG